MIDLGELYQEVILDHAKKPRNFGPLAGATHQADGYNPLCGDQVQLRLIVKNRQILAAKFEGCGCAISTASASMLTDLVTGRTIDDAKSLGEQFRNVLKGESDADLGDLEPLRGVKEFPMRVKCATLAWHALATAVQEPYHA